MKNLDRDMILNFLKQYKDLMHDEYGVVKIGLIGSYSRNEQNDESDIDFLVEFTEPRFHYHAGLILFLEEKLGKKADIVRNRTTLKKWFLERVEKEAIYA
jgi:predicted nucleotidyltransferase